MSETKRYRHKKRGTEYEVVGLAELQMNFDNLYEGDKLVIYRGDDGKLWAREHSEFHDGRFEPVDDRLTDYLSRAHQQIKEGTSPENVDLDADILADHTPATSAEPITEEAGIVDERFYDLMITGYFSDRTRAGGRTPATSAERQDEPVAWMYERRGRLDLVPWRWANTCPDDPWTETPLYAHPATDSTADKIEGARLALEKAARLCGSLAETTYDDADGFEAATGCESFIRALDPAQIVKEATDAK